MERHSFPASCVSGAVIRTSFTFEPCPLACVHACGRDVGTGTGKRASGKSGCCHNKRHSQPATQRRGEAQLLVTLFMRNQNKRCTWMTLRRNGLWVRIPNDPSRVKASKS
jgi:hypothetical protein